MTDLFGSIVWLVGSVALLALLWIAYYAITKIGTLLTGRSVEVDFMFFLGGAFIGMLFLPSGDHATAESRLMLALAIIAGAFFGGLIGLFVDIYSSRKPSPSSGSPHAEGTASIQNWSIKKAISRIGGLVRFASRNMWGNCHSGQIWRHANCEPAHSVPARFTVRT